MSDGKEGAFAEDSNRRLSAYDYRVLDESTASIVSTVKGAGAMVYGPVPLPVRKRRYDLLRSPHKDKKSREQLEIREHVRFAGCR